MLNQYKNKNYTRFIIYFLIFLIVYQFIQLVYHGLSTPTEENMAQVKVESNNKEEGYKQQTILEFQADNQTYLDFPWYQTAHTRPQFHPNASLLTTHLSLKEREIVLQKAILQAKKRAQKKFPVAEYQGIRGTQLTTKEAADTFRARLACWTQGDWVHDDKKAFGLKHIQDPIYSRCDNTFYKTHKGDERREATQYGWVPSASECRLKNSINPKSWCKALRGRNILLVGDLVHYQYHEVLLDAFRDEPTVCFGELNCKGKGIV